MLQAQDDHLMGQEDFSVTKGTITSGEGGSLSTD